jgi:hypothetical protein
LNTLLAVAITQAKDHIKADDDLVTQLKAAMMATKNHWLVTNDNDRFLAAVAAVMEFYGEGSDVWKQLENKIKNLNKIGIALAAAEAGVSVDWASLVNELPDQPEIVGLQQLWFEVKNQ